MKLKETMLCITIGGVILFLLGMPGCFDTRFVPSSSHYTVREDIKKIYSIEKPTQLSLHNTTGSISIEVWDNDYIEALGLKRAATEEDLEGIEIEVVQKTNEISLRTIYHKQFVNAFINYVVKVPQQVSIKKVKTGSGSVRISGVSGDIRVDSRAGRIDVLGANGKVVARTGSGAVVVQQKQKASGLICAHTGSGRVHVKNAHGIVEVTAGSGSIFIEQAQQATGYIEASTGSGRIDIAHAVDSVSAVTSSGTIVVKHCGPKKEHIIDLRSSSGRLELILPKYANASVNVQTDLGYFRSAFGLLSAENNIAGYSGKICGDIGTGGAQVSLNSSMGNISIAKCYG